MWLSVFFGFSSRFSTMQTMLYCSGWFGGGFRSGFPVVRQKPPSANRTACARYRVIKLLLLKFALFFWFRSSLIPLIRPALNTSAIKIIASQLCIRAVQGLLRNFINSQINLYVLTNWVLCFPSVYASDAVILIEDCFISLVYLPFLRQ